jgi:hypothetical protein
MVVRASSLLGTCLPYNLHLLEYKLCYINMINLSLGVLPKAR